MSRPTLQPGPRASAGLLGTVPNALSVVRLALVPVFLWLFVTDREEPAVLVFALGAFTDGLDGFIARRTDSVSDLGKVLDPVVDRIFIAAIAAALVTRGTLALPLALAILLRDILLLSMWPVLDRRGVERIPVSFMGKCATALLLVGLTSAALSETTFGVAAAAGTVGRVAVGIGAALYWLAAIMYAREASRRLRGLRDAAPIS